MSLSLRFTELVVLAGLLLLVGPGVGFPATELPKEPEKLSAADAVDAYLAVLEDVSQTAIKRNYAGSRIAAMGDKALPHLVELYADADAERRGYLAAIAGAMDAAKTGPMLKLLLEDVDRHGLSAHPNVIKALGDLHAVASVPRLMELLPGAPDGARQGILYALGQIGELKSAQELFGGLDDADRVTRAACANGIVNILRGPRTEAKSPPVVKPSAEEIRDRARDYRALFDRVIEYADSGKTDDSRMVLIDGLGMLLAEGVDGLPVGSADASRASRALSRLLGRDSQPVGVRMVAAESLGRLHDREAVTDLTDVLSHAEDAPLRHAALGALVAIGDRSCVPVLIERLQTRSDTEATAAEIAERRLIVNALRQLTGQPFSDNPEQWRQWWVASGERIAQNVNQSEEKPR